MMDVTGLDEVLRNLDAVERRIVNKSRKKTKMAADHVLNKTIPVTPMSPLGTETSGDLRKSGKVIIETTVDGTDGIVSFGDGRVGYAAAVHEMAANANWSEDGTGNKYLERTFRKEKDNIMNFLEGSVDV